MDNFEVHIYLIKLRTELSICCFNLSVRSLSNSWLIQNRQIFLPTVLHTMAANFLAVCSTYKRPSANCSLQNSRKTITSCKPPRCLYHLAEVTLKTECLLGYCQKSDLWTFKCAHDQINIHTRPPAINSTISVGPFEISILACSAGFVRNSVFMTCRINWISRP